MKRILSVVTEVCFFSATNGCYNTYVLEKDEFGRLQRAPDNSRNVTVTDKAGKKVAVSDGTSVYVRSTGGRRYQVTPFNFKMTESQLVASDRDTLLAVDGIDAYEVDHLSTWKTVLLASLGAGATAAVIFAIIFTSGQKTFEE